MNIPGMTIWYIKQAGQDPQVFGPQAEEWEMRVIVPRGSIPMTLSGKIEALSAIEEMLEPKLSWYERFWRWWIDLITTTHKE